MMMRRGEVWWVSFPYGKGGEIQKNRPAVIVSNDISNKKMNRLQVIPLTSQVDKCYPSEAYVTVDGKDGKAMADQISTVDKSRLMRYMGKISFADIADLERAIKVQLDLH